MYRKGLVAQGALGRFGFELCAFWRSTWKVRSLLAAALNNDASLTVRYGCGAVTSVLAV